MPVLIGAAWPYASGPRHVGHLAGAYLPADVLARTHRLSGDDVLFVSGSDQFGTPITVAAERAGVDPATFADEQHEAIAGTLARVGITFDHYTKTSTDIHARVVAEVFGRLRSRGFVAEGEDVVAWCPRHRRALPDRYVEGRCPACGAEGARGDQCDECGTTLDASELIAPRCRECRSLAQLRPQRQLFLRLDALAPAVAAHLDAAAGGWRPWITEEAKGALRTGLRARGITRDLPWGVRVPLEGWDDRRLYVWFDAVIGYLSATVEWAEQRGEPQAWKRWWCTVDAGGGSGATALRHRYLVGKDNVFFHAIFWPAILAGTGGLRLPDDLIASHHLTESGAQLSTSRGHGTTIDDAIDLLGVDPLRHAACALAPETADSELRREAVADLTRTGLLGAIANPAHRVATLVWRRFGGSVDAAVDATSREEATRALDEVRAALLGARFRAGLDGVHSIGREINRRLASSEPWRLDDAGARAAVADVLPWVDALAIAAWPVVPGTAERIRATWGREPAPASWVLPSDPPTIAAPPQPPL